MEVSGQLYAPAAEGKRSLGRPRCRWDDNIRMNFKEVGEDIVDWIHLAQDRCHWWVLVNTIMKLRVPKKRA
jgi:hypothetical protein